jgi:DNA-directed RNA polymerase subunit RPC12/RpoP
VLSPTRDKYIWKCAKCEEKYYSCAQCSEGLDWEDNDKGSLCEECGYHLCAGCFFREDSEAGFREVDGRIVCDECGKKLEEELRKEEDDEDE